jgi:hypothetical protein
LCWGNETQSVIRDVQLLTEDYSENSFKKIHASVQTADQGRTLGADDPKCSSETLRAIMLEARSPRVIDLPEHAFPHSQQNIVLSPTISKQLIFSAGRLAFGASIDVICSKNKFSYTVVSYNIFIFIAVGNGFERIFRSAPKSSAKPAGAQSPASPFCNLEWSFIDFSIIISVHRPQSSTAARTILEKQLQFNKNSFCSFMYFIKYLIFKF